MTIVHALPNVRKHGMRLYNYFSNETDHKVVGSRGLILCCKIIKCALTGLVSTSLDIATTQTITPAQFQSVCGKIRRGAQTGKYLA